MAEKNLDQIKKNKYPLTKPSQLLFDFAVNLIKEGKLDAVSAKRIEKTLTDFRGKSEEQLEAFLNSVSPIVRNRLKREYYRYVTGGYSKLNPGVTALRIQDLKPQFRKELQNATDMSLGLIKTQNEQMMLKLENRFRNWANISSKDLRGRLTDDSKMISTLRKDILDEPDLRFRTKKHLQFIITDQTRKLLGNMDNITANECGAIGFIWVTRSDDRVVGKPGGLYPKADNPQMHGNHYAREGKFYLFRDNWAIKSGYLISRDGVIYADELPDGMPSAPIGCRCMAKNVYNLEDIPARSRGCITKRGQEFIEREF